ncbi:MAG: CDP-alcohol phosphatidyltransferase family protein [Anaerolineaceae bacterium]|nr:CDP-alcohol phosphatidyltransferase family protein [Anaerolineaceae bacterium]
MTDLLRKVFGKLLNSIAVFLNSLGFSPNLMTILGVLGNILAAWFISKGNLVTGGVMVLVFGSFDAIDGSMARLQGGETKSGAFLDSVMDRYSEFAIFLGILVYSLRNSNPINCILVFLATAGSVLVSYIRARAQSLGVETKIGILTRVERYLVIVPSLLLGRPDVGLWIIAILGNVTAFQRIWHVWQQLKQLE